MTPGDRTQDLNALGEPHPTENAEARHKPTVSNAERHLQRVGDRCLGGGVIAGLLGVIIIAVARDNLRDSSPPFLTFSLIIAWFSTCGAFMVTGLIERISRYPRAMQRRILERLEAVEKAMEAVPDFGQGVVLGVELRQQTVPPDRG